MKMRRMKRLALRQSDHAEQKAKNRVRKKSERARRDVMMTETIKSGSLPYTPEVMSWLSRKLDKQSTKITPEDVKTLLV